jgi:hypothetical protein
LVPLAFAETLAAYQVVGLSRPGFIVVIVVVRAVCSAFLAAAAAAMLSTTSISIFCAKSSAIRAGNLSARP